MKININLNNNEKITAKNFCCGNWYIPNEDGPVFVLFCFKSNVIEFGVCRVLVHELKNINETREYIKIREPKLITLEF